MSWEGTPVTWVNGEPVGAYDLNREVRDRLLYLAHDAPPNRATLYHYNSFVVAGNAIAIAADASQQLNFVAYQNPPAVDHSDVFTQSCWLAPGLYTIDFCYRTQSDAGMFLVSLDGDYDSFPLYIDTYSAFTVRNVHTTLQLRNLQAPQRHVLSISVPAKNAASSDYALYLTSIAITRYEED